MKYRIYDVIEKKCSSENVIQVITWGKVWSIKLSEEKSGLREYMQYECLYEKFKTHDKISIEIS